MESSDITIIRPQRGWIGIDFRELWRYRELIGFLVWRDITVRYKQTLLGVAWVIIQPLISMVVLTVIFGKLINVSTDGLPYPIFSYGALVIWTFFADSLRRSTNSLIINTSLVSKIYFPRLILPISCTLGGVVDFAIAFMIFIGMFVYYKIPLRFEVLYMPLFFLLTFGLALGTGCWLSALNVKYRDIGYTVPFVSQIWMFASPVAYSSTIVPEKWSYLYGLNPMAGVVQGFRWALLGQGRPSGTMLTASVIITLLVLISGIYYFRRMEGDFADVI